MSSLGAYLRETSVPGFIIVCMFAMSSWIDMNGFFVEIPLLVNKLPEGWNLPSFLVIIGGLANIGPILYTIAKKIAPDRVKEWPVVYIIISIGMIACALLVFFWSSTSYINGVEHSTALFILFGFLGLVDSTSSVVYLPYMAAFKSQYLIAYFVGEGLGGLLPALMGFAQGAGGNAECLNTTKNGASNFEIIPVYSPPRFSISVYFGILFVFLCASMTSFSLLHFHPYCRRFRIETGSYGGPMEHSAQVASDIDENTVNGFSLQSDSQPIGQGSLNEPQQGITLAEVTFDFKPITNRNATPADSSKKSISNIRMITLLALTFWLNALLYGVLPALHSYSCLPYGNLAYTLTIQLAVLVNPLACFVALFFSIEHLGLLVMLSAVGTLLSAYQITLAVLSPYPPLYDQTAGVVIMILACVLLVAIFNYVKVCIAGVLSRTRGPTGLLYCGILTQVGSLIGGIITFILVNILELFESIPPCP